MGPSKAGGGPPSPEGRGGSPPQRAAAAARELKQGFLISVCYGPFKGSFRKRIQGPFKGSLKGAIEPCKPCIGLISAAFWALGLLCWLLKWDFQRQFR